MHINPLWFGELPTDLIPEIRECAATLGADAQGFVRKVGADGQLYHGDWDGKECALPHIDVFKVDIKEAEILTGSTDVRVAAGALSELGAGVVILTHKDGVCVFDGGTCHVRYVPKPSVWSIRGSRVSMGRSVVLQASTRTPWPAIG